MFEIRHMDKSGCYFLHVNIHHSKMEFLEKLNAKISQKYYMHSVESVYLLRILEK